MGAIVDVIKQFTLGNVGDVESQGVSPAYHY